MQDTEELYANLFNEQREADARLKSQQQDEHILDCARKLIQAIEDSGRRLEFEHDGKIEIPVSFLVYVFDHYEPAKVVVKSYHKYWEVKGDYKV